MDTSMFAGTGDDYLKMQINWPLLYTMIAIIDSNQLDIVYDKPSAISSGGRLVRNMRGYRRRGGNVESIKTTRLPAEVYRAWTYFEKNAAAINSFLYKSGAIGAAKGVFVYMKSTGESMKRRRTLFKSPYYTHLITQVAERAINRKANLSGDDRVSASVDLMGMKEDSYDYSMVIAKGDTELTAFNRNAWPDVSDVTKL